MTNLHVYDDHNHLFLTGFCLPQQAVFRHQPGSHDGATPELIRVPDDRGMAEITTAMARYLAERRLEWGGHVGESSRIGLDTWVLSRSKGEVGRLSSWFTGGISTARYHVFIHRTPRRCLGYPMPLLWDLVYEDFEAKRTPRLERRDVSTMALRAGAEVLSELLPSYRAGADEVRARVAGLGHPYLRVTDADR